MSDEEIEVLLLNSLCKLVDLDFGIDNFVPCLQRHVAKYPVFKHSCCVEHSPDGWKLGLANLGHCTIEPVPLGNVGADDRSLYSMVGLEESYSGFSCLTVYSGTGYVGEMHGSSGSYPHGCLSPEPVDTADQKIIGI